MYWIYPFQPEVTDSSKRRRRSGIDLVTGGSAKVSVLANGHDGPVSMPIKTRLPKIKKGPHATGIWSRKISPAGVSYLKMDDEVSTKQTGKVNDLKLLNQE